MTQITQQLQNCSLCSKEYEQGKILFKGGKVINVCSLCWYRETGRTPPPETVIADAKPIVEAEVEEQVDVRDIEEYAPNEDECYNPLVEDETLYTWAEGSGLQMKVWCNECKAQNKHRAKPYSVKGIANHIKFKHPNVEDMEGSRPLTPKEAREERLSYVRVSELQNVHKAVSLAIEEQIKALYQLKQLRKDIEQRMR